MLTPSDDRLMIVGRKLYIDRYCTLDFPLKVYGYTVAYSDDRH